MNRELWALARTPRWIGGLLIALLIACAFGALGQWQISRAVASGTHDDRATETVVPLTSIAKPQVAVTMPESGQKVSVVASDAHDYTIVSGRYNGGVEGYWVMARYTAADGSALAVAAGWTADRDTAESLTTASATTAAPIELIGRYLASEGPDTQATATIGTTASVESLVNRWRDPAASVYNGYLVSDVPLLPGLDAIDSPKPTSEVTLNWLNVFYAIEWVVFAILAFYMWFRLLRDAHERQLEEAEEAAAAEDAHVG